MWQQVAVGAIFFVAMVVNAITGFAGNLLAMPGTIQLIGMTYAKVISTLIGTYNCVVLAFMTWRFVNWHEVKKITVLIIPGMLVGFWLYYFLDVKVLLYIYGSVIVAVAIRTFLKQDGPRKMGLITTLLVMFFAGLMQSLFVSGGAFVVLYAVCVFKDKDEFRATLSTLWVFLNLIVLAQEGIAGEINTDNFLLSLYVGIPALFGIYFGNRIHHKVSGKTFFNIANVLLLISGLSCFLK